MSAAHANAGTVEVANRQMLRKLLVVVVAMFGFGYALVPIYEVMTRKHLTMVTLEENLAMAADIGMDATTSLQEAFDAALALHGPDAKVVILPFARYQLARNMIRMSVEDAPPVTVVEAV